MKLLTFILGLCAVAHAAAPITCSALTGLGYNYVYFGFAGFSSNVFAMAGSPLQSIPTGGAEGPSYLKTNNTAGWYFYYENISGSTSARHMTATACFPLTLPSCTLATTMAWMVGNAVSPYRHGGVLYLGTDPYDPNHPGCCWWRNP